MEIIFEDESILVIHKPSGLATQTNHVGQKDVVSECKKYFMKQGNKNPYVGLVHRLDQPVEGLLIIGKTKEATANLSKQLTDNIFNKRYYAIVFGVIKKEKDCYIDFIEKNNQVAKILKEKTPLSKKAILSYEILNTLNKEITLLDVEI